MAIFYDAATMTGTSGDDFMTGHPVGGANHSLYGGDGDDVLFGDYDYFLSQPEIAWTALFASDSDLTDVTALWSLAENPDVADATLIPHMSVISEGEGQFNWFRFDLVAGQTLSVDIDYGTHEIGGSFDAVVEVFAADGTTFIDSNDDSSPLLGAGGSTNGFDSFLTYTPSVTATYYIRIRQVGLTVIDVGDSYIANFSLTGQAVTNTSPVNGNDLLDGGTGNDVLYGMAGNDSLIGGIGDDRLDGGSGDDTLSGGNNYDTLFGGDGEDLLNGGLYKDTSYGGAGGDTFQITGGDNADDVYGGADTDLLDLSLWTAVTQGFDVNLELATYRFLPNPIGVDGIYVLDSVAYVFGSLADDRIIGDAQNNLLYGGAGDDTIDGGIGIDTVAGGAGNDLIFVDNALDSAYEVFGGGTNDRVAARSSYTLSAETQIELLTTTSNGGTDAINLTGNSFAQRITGNAGANTLSSGAAGAADTLTGLAGDDLYRIYNAADIIVEAAGGGTNDRVVSAVSFTLAADDDIEVLGTQSSAGTAAINLTGNALAQRIFGNAGINTLSSGGAGAADTMTGFAGNDVYRVFNAGDIIVEAAGGGTNDRVATTVSFTLATDDDIELFTTTSSGGVGAINLTGNGLAQTIIGNAGANRIDGKGGADTLDGGAGADVFVFSSTVSISNADKILNYDSAVDQIELENAKFTGMIDTNLTLATSAFIANDTGLASAATHRIIYETDTGFLWFDQDGVAGGAIRFASVDIGTALAANDFTVI